MSVIRSGAWRWGVVDASSPAAPGVIGVDGDFLVVSVVDSNGVDLSDVLAALGVGDLLNVGSTVAGTGPPGEPGPPGPPGERGPAGPEGPRGPAGQGITILSAVPTAADLPATGNSPGDAHLASDTGNLWVWGTDNTWHELGHIQGPEGPPGTVGDLLLDDLVDVDVHLSATGMLLTKQIDGSWKGANFSRPLNWLTDVVAPDDAQGVLGTTAPGVWEPLPMDHLQQQIVGPLPTQVAGLDARITALEATPEPTPVDFALTVDNYSGGFTRVINAQVIGTDTVRVTVALATTPGPNGEVFADLSAISGTANVWADFAGTLGRVEDALTGTPIHGAALKEIIRRGTVVLVHRDNTDPSHPTLKVDGTEAAGQPGTSLTLASLADVDNAAATAPAGQVLGTTATGQWAPVPDHSNALQATVNSLVGVTFDTLPEGWTSAGAYPSGTYVWYHPGVVPHEAWRLYKATADVPANSPPPPADGARWAPMPTLGELLPVTDAARDAPAGKVLGTTGPGVWEPVDPPSGLPPTSVPRPSGAWTYNGVGAATVPGEVKVNSATSVTTLRVNPVDADGIDQSARIDALQVGDILTMTHAGAPLDLHVRGAINTSGSRNIPVDAVSPSAFTQGEAIHLEFPAEQPSAADGDVLTVVAGTPAWATPATGGGGDPRVGEVVAATYGGTLPPTWVAQAYPAGATVTQDGAVWTTPAGASPTDIPGATSGNSAFRWYREDAAYLLQLLEAAIGQPGGISTWYPTLWSSGAVVLHEGKLWRGSDLVASTKVPGVAPEWELFDLSAGVDPTGLAQLPPTSGTKPAGYLAHSAVASYTTNRGAVWIARHDTTTVPPNSPLSNADWRRVTPAENALAIHELSMRIPDPTSAPVGAVLKKTANGIEWVAP